jgi:hypothetical protein
MVKQMLEKEFYEALQNLYVNNPHPNISASQLENIRQQFAYLLQSYLWEGEALKTLNKTNYRKLAIAWHPDKLKAVDNNPAFLSWYIQINEKDPGSLFKVLSYVKETYRPELRYRAQDANDRNNENNKNFHFFSAFATHLPLIYNVFWPIFYALESLERNLDNYSEERRGYAKAFYIGSILFLPFSILLILKLDRLGDLIIDLITYQAPWIGEILSNGIAGMSFAIAAFYTGFSIANHFKYFRNTELSSDFLAVTFYQIPFTPVFETFKEFKQNINNKAPFKRKLLSLGKCALASLAAVTQISVTVYGLYYALPLIGAFALFPVAGLMLANFPLMMSQIYHQPRNSFALLGEYFITIGTHYFHLAKKACQFVYNSVHAVLSKFSPIAAWVKHLFSSTPKAVTKPTAPPAPPVAIPYWKTKFDKYMQQDEDKIAGKRNKFKKQRNTVLTTMGVGEDHPFKEKLDDLINQKSATYDEKGFVEEDSSDKKFATLEVLNLKTQVLFLNTALEKKSYLPRAQFEAAYPQDLDYRKLVAKNTLG